MRCPACAQDQPAGNRFCEDCGTRLDRPTLDGATDRGKRYTTNQDAFALATDPAGDVLVVCDGVSSSQTPDAAARAGSAAARDFLLAALRDGITDDTGAVAAAVSAAHAAVAALPFDPDADLDPPETTIVAAVRRGWCVAVGWLGDSRAYHITADTVRQLTDDHSWLREEVEAGAITLEEGLRSPLAHAVTRTLGGPDGGDEPETRAFDLPPGPGLLLLCTDGLWAAFPDPADLAREAWRLAADGDAGTVARGLVVLAVERYGRDNTTAAVLFLASAEA